jgi:type I restriction enzyme S subunit
MKGWVTKKLGEVCDIKHGFAFKSEFFANEGEFVVLTPGNYYEAGGYRDRGEKQKYYTGEIPSEYIMKEGDMLVVMTEQAAGLLGSPLLVPESGKFLHNQRLGLVIPKPGIPWCSEFFFHLFNTESVRKAIHDSASGVKVRHTSPTKIGEVEVSFPPLAEQQRIVGLLDEAFEGLATAKANAEKNLQNARALFESHLQAVFTQRGPGWVETTLDKATAGVFTGPFGSLLHKHDYVENGIPLVNPAHITDTGIEPDMMKTVSENTAKRLVNYIMREGDVVIGRRGEMGRCALVTEVEDGWLCGTGSFYIKPSDRCDMGYLVRYLRSEGCRKKLEALAGGAVMPNLSNTALGGLSIFLPSLREQKEIVNEIDALSAETQRLASLYERKLAALEALKKSLLHQAFSGTL